MKIENKEPVIGEIYHLTYFGASSARGVEIVSEDFTFMCKRRSGYYLLSTSGVIDLVVKQHLFDEYLENTVDKLRKR